ncbi:MAG: DUF2189 domain-containing protein [Candidatus Thiodiazotropha sp. (ex Epidulcina cf. delphinae)]|nr:DUF2189 domain-containing protein [Candidatus Thiodiazotropha sp. (ex Epidulcina cf. delphinae)]
MNTAKLDPRKIGISDLFAAIGAGWNLFRLIPMSGVAYASVAALIGSVLLFGVGKLGISPMSPPLVGGFMLIAPAMLSGFFQLSLFTPTGIKPTLATPFLAFFRTPTQTWVIAVFCAFIFLIWITDAGVVYGFVVGERHLPYQPPWMLRVDEKIVSFWFWTGLMGSVLAFAVFCVSAFSVPLLFEGRATLVQAVHASVRAVFKNFFVAVLWGSALTLSISIAVLLMPLLLLVLPVMAYASFALYRCVFPQLLPNPAGGASAEIRPI